MNNLRRGCEGGVIGVRNKMTGQEKERKLSSGSQCIAAKEEHWGFINT